jgi:hypothetical protein
MLLNFPIELAILIIHAVDWLEGDQLDWVGRKIGGVLLLSDLGRTVLEFVFV